MINKSEALALARQEVEAGHLICYHDAGDVVYAECDQGVFPSPWWPDDYGSDDLVDG